VSGYGGQPPGWQDPYGQQPQGYQGGYQDAYGYGPQGYPPQPPASNGAAIGALVCNIILTMTCCGFFAVAGIVTAAIAMGRAQTDPDSYRNLTRWSWIIFAVNIVIAVLAVIAYFSFFAYSISHTPSGSTP
jgi:heme/copper-type cytochrome/quinol oxidase subunit 2